MSSRHPAVLWRIYSDKTCFASSLRISGFETISPTIVTHVEEEIRKNSDETFVCICG